MLTRARSILALKNAHLHSLSRKFSTSTTKTKEYDIVVVGGGAVGLSFIKQILASQSQSLSSNMLSIALIEGRSVPTKEEAKSSISKNDSTVVNGGISRAYALSESSLQTLGINDIIKPLDMNGYISWYDKMQIWESNGPAILNFTSNDLNNNNTTTTNNSLGCVIEDKPLVSSLWNYIYSNKDDTNNSMLDIYAPFMVKHVKAPYNNELVTLSLISTNNNNNNTNGSSSSEKEIKARLVVAADGANSSIRRMLGMKTINIGYGRRAVTCTVRLNKSLNSTAFQIFHPSGPIALLPLPCNNNNNDDNIASIVWSTTPQHASHLTSLSSNDFIKELQDALLHGPTLLPPLTHTSSSDNDTSILSSTITSIQNLAQSINHGLTLHNHNQNQPFQPPPKPIKLISNKCFAFDLILSHSTSYVQRRIALIGDAAHTIHPMAGQGLNLGLADANYLSQIITKGACNVGMDIGDLYYLNQYEKHRQNNALLLMVGIQFLHLSFSSPFVPIIYAKSIGMNFVNFVTPVKKKLVHMAAFGVLDNHYLL